MGARRGIFPGKAEHPPPFPLPPSRNFTAFPKKAFGSDGGQGGMKKCPRGVRIPEPRRKSFSYASRNGNLLR